jgi:hypothetical protein
MQYVLLMPVKLPHDGVPVCITIVNMLDCPCTGLVIGVLQPR